MIWQNSRQVSLALETCFSDIQNRRIADLAIINPKLKVQAINFQLIREYYLGVLITPWFMNLVYIDNSQLPIGSSVQHDFPAGRFAFNVAYETELGYFQTCSLFSPMFEFQQHSVAVQTAEAVLQTLLIKPAISRRDLLLGNFRHTP